MALEAGVSGVNQNPLAYTGTPTSYVPCGWFSRDPATTDVNFPFMFIWGNESTGNMFIRTNTASVWDQIAEGTGGSSVAEGGTGRTSLTDRALIVGSGTDPVDFIGPAAAGTVLQGAGASADPVFSTATYPATTTINQVLYSSAANTVAGLTTANNGTMVTSATGVPSILAGPGTTGTILQSNAAAAPSFSTATYPSTSTISEILYSSAANTVSGLATANNGTLVTSATGVPSVLAGPGTTGNLLQSNAAAAPSFSTATYPATTAINELLYSSAADTVGGLTTANNGTLVTSAAGVPSILAGPGTTGNILQANAAAAPSFSTATYPVTTTINQVLYSSAADTVSELATANNGTFVTSAAGVPSILAGPGTTGNILQANAAAAPSFSTAVYPSTTAISEILYSSAADTVAGLTTANNGTLVTSNAGVPSLLAGPGTTGNILQSNAAAAPSFSTATYPSTTAQGDLLSSTTANAVIALAKDTNATRYLANTGATNNAQWDQVNLTNGVTGTLPIANGGTGLGGSEGTVQTTDATPTNALTIALGATPLTYMITAFVSAYASVGIGTPLGAGFFVQGAVRTTGAAATLIAQTPTPYAEGALAASTAVLGVSANNAVITVTGVALYTVDWKVEVISVTQGA